MFPAGQLRPFGEFQMYQAPNFPFFSSSCDHIDIVLQVASIANVCSVGLEQALCALHSLYIFKPPCFWRRLITEPACKLWTLRLLVAPSYLAMLRNGAVQDPLIKAKLATDFLCCFSDRGGVASRGPGRSRENQD